VKTSKEEFIARISKAIRRNGEGIPSSVPLPEHPEASHVGDCDSFIDLFIEGITRSRGHGIIASSAAEVTKSLIEILHTHSVHSCILSCSDVLCHEFGLEDLLDKMDIVVVPARAPREELYKADAGITEAACAIADTGTLVSLSTPREPRSASLMPPIHISIVRAESIVKDLEGAFHKLSNIAFTNGYKRVLTSCISFITGPSRTADIELSLTLGVHGPKEVYVLIYKTT
jgi:L-lactate dehydrogenase complex protein LldG